MSSEGRSERGFGWLLKLAGLAAFAVLLWRKPELVTSAWEAITQVRPEWCAAGTLALFGALWMSALRTDVILRATGYRMPAHKLFVHLMQGLGLNAVVTGMAVFYRIERIHRETKDIDVSVAVILLERMFAVGSLLVSGAFGLMIVGGSLGEFMVDARRIELAAAGGLAVVVVLALVFPRIARAVYARVRPVLMALLSKPQALVLATLISAANLVLTVVWIYCLSRGLGHAASFWAYFFAVGIVNLATVLPITVGGFGIREAGYAILLAPFGVTKGAAIALGVVQYATSLVPGVIGAIWFFASRDAIPDVRALMRRSKSIPPPGSSIPPPPPGAAPPGTSVPSAQSPSQDSRSVPPRSA